MTAGEMVGDVNDVQLGAARRHRRDGRPRCPRASPSPSASARACSTSAGSAWREAPGGAAASCPPLPADALDPGESGGDLCVQACADDPQVAFHAVRNLARIGRGTVVMRWSQLGFGRTSSTSRARTRRAT